MKKFWLAGLFVALVSVFISCGNEINEVSENTNTNVSGETYIVIGSSSVARTIRPTSSEVKALESSLTDFTFVGVDSNENQKNFTETAISTFTELKKQKFAIVPGTWSFTLSAKLGEDGATFSDTLENIVIESGKTTTLTFALESEDCGGLSIKVKFADENVTHINASLTKLGEPSFDAREKTFNKLNSDESTDFVTEKEGEVTEYSVTYSCDGTNASEELSAGTYHLVFDFYSEGTDVPINSIPYDVRVLGGITTKATQSVKINETYTITYVLNDDEASPAEIASGVMTTKFSRKCEPIDYPEMKREGYIWGGWRFDEDSTEVVAGLASEATGDVTVYARWYEPNLYVSASGSSSNSGFYDSEPVDSIGNAISTIKRYNASGFDWTIYIDGTVYGTYTLDLDSDFANSLTFAGIHENKDDNYTDILDGGSVYTENESDATIKGSVFTVYSYCVPVIIRNLKITHGISSGGYGGAFDTSGNITLEDGAWVTDNHTYYSGGAVVNSGTFTMKEGSRITNNSSKDWGGGVWAGGGSFIMEGGEISGNTSSRGLAIDVSGEFRIGGTASIPAGDDPDNPQDVCLSSESPFTPDSITITDNLSGISSVIKIRADSQYKGLQILNTVDGVELTSEIINKFEIVQPSGDECLLYISKTGTLEYTEDIITGTTVYDYSTSGYTFYDSTDTTNAILELNSNKFSYDQYGNLFAFKSVDTSASIVTSKAGYSGTEYSVDCVEMNGGHGLMIDRKNNVLYTYFLNYGSTTAGTIYKYESFLSSPTNSPTSSSYTFDLSSVPNLKVELMQVYDGELYTYGNKILAKATIEASAITGLTKVADISLSDGFPGAPYDYWTVSDMLYQDGSIYLLYNEKRILPDDSESPFLVNRGAVIRVRVNDGTVGTVDSCGWANEDSDLVFLDFGAESTAKYSLITQHWDASYNFYAKPVYTDENRTAFKTLDKASFNSDLLNNYNYMTIYDSSNNPTGEIGIKTQMVAPSKADSKFYSPQKFIAIKPKKLVIADSGIAFYTTDDGMWAYKNVNRIVTVDLEEFAIESVKDAGVRFNAIQNDTLSLSGSGYYTNYKGGVTGYYYSDTAGSYVQGTPTSGACWLGIPNFTDNE